MADIDLGQIKKNVGIMVDKGAPESDIDAYIKGEGTTIDAVRNYNAEPQYTGVHGAIQKLGSLWPKDMTPVDVASIVPAVATEGLAGEGIDALGAMATRASPRVAQMMAEGQGMRGLAKIGAGAASGAAGWGAAGAGAGALNAPPGKRLKGAEEGGAAGALMGGIAGGALPAAKGAYTALRHPVETAGAIFKSGMNTATALGKPVIQPAARNIIESEFGGGLKQAVHSPAAKEAGELEKRIPGLKFTTSEKTKNPTAVNLADAFANTVRHGERFAVRNEANTNAIINKFKDTLNQIYPESVSKSAIGDKIVSAYDSTIKALVDARRAQADIDFKAAEMESGGKPVVSPHNFINTVKNFIEESKSPLATPAQKAAGKQAQVVLDNLKLKPREPSIILDASGKPVERAPVEEYRKITVRDLQNGLSSFGDAAYSGKGIWKDLATASDRRFSVAAKHALQQDLDDAAEKGGTALKIARDNYLSNSNKLADIEKSAIGKMVGNAEHTSEGKLVVVPEKIADKFSAMQPSEITSTLKFLDKYHPDVAKAARRYTLEKPFREALESVGQRGAGESNPFAKAKFVSGLPSEDKLKALLGSRKEAKEVEDVASAFNRIINYGAEKMQSRTAQRSETLLSFSASLGKGAMYRSIVSDSLIDDLLNPERLEELSKDAKRINQITP